MPKECKSADIPDNGVRLTDSMLADFKRFDPLKSSSDFDFEFEKQYYEQLGLTESNVYLHIKGHYLYNLIKHIGQQLCSSMRINFEHEVLLDTIALDEYWEIEHIGLDLGMF